jgi:hypothetical protein
MRRVVAICGLIGTAALPVAGREPLTIAVSPAFAAAIVKVSGQSEPNTDNPRPHHRRGRGRALSQERNPT